MDKRRESGVPHVKLREINITEPSPFNYVVTMKPHDCGHDLPLLGLVFKL